MASLRRLIVGTSADVLSTENIRKVLVASTVNLWATSVTVTDTIAMFLGATELMPAGPMNVAAAALGLIDIARDQLIFNAVVRAGELRLPVGTLTTSLIFLLTVDPIV